MINRNIRFTKEGAIDMDFDEFIQAVLRSEDICPNDNLSREIKSVQEDELSSDELELVSAAGTDYYEKFRTLYIDNK